MLFMFKYEHGLMESLRPINPGKTHTNIDILNAAPFL